MWRSQTIRSVFMKTHGRGRRCYDDRRPTPLRREAFIFALQLALHVGSGLSFARGRYKASGK